MLLLLCGIFAVASQPRTSNQVVGRVIGVSDGDTATILIEGTKVKVRLEGIDAPESGQSFGGKSKDALIDLIHNKSVIVEETGIDKYGRTLAFLKLGDSNINALMVERGWAWHFKKYSDNARLAQLEKAAQSEKRGLWADRQPLPPWEFRARARQRNAENSSQAFSTQYWLNLSSGARHNSSCEFFRNTKRGRHCDLNEGKPCSRCGG